MRQEIQYSRSFVCNEDVEGACQFYEPISFSTAIRHSKVVYYTYL